MTAITTDFFADLGRLRSPIAAFTPEGVERLAASKPPPRAKKISGEFLKGPIPIPWLKAATGLSGKAPLAVALAIWFEAGRRKSNEVKLTTKILTRFSVNRKAKYIALKALEKAGLVRVFRRPHKNPIVTILVVQGEPEASGTSRS